MSKYFNVNNPTQTVTITNEHDSFYQLSDGNMIKKESFLTKYQPVLDGFETSHINESFNQSTHIDPNSFFNSTSISTSDIDILKKTNTSNVPDISDSMRSEIKVNTTDKTTTKAPIYSNESLVTRTNDNTIPNNTNIDVSQYKVYDDDDEAYDDFINKSGINVVKQPVQQVQPQQYVPNPMDEINRLYDDEIMAFGKDEADNRKNKRLGKIKLSNETQPQQNVEFTSDSQTQQITQTHNMIDPIKMMFSTFKRNHDITINIEFKDKIGNPDFIKMMVENMDGDIIEYYKELIMDNIKKDLNKIESVVKLELEKAIYGEDYTTKSEIDVNPTKKTPKKPTKRTPLKSSKKQVDEIKTETPTNEIE